MSAIALTSRAARIAESATLEAMGMTLVSVISICEATRGQLVRPETLLEIVADKMGEIDGMLKRAALAGPWPEAEAWVNGTAARPTGEAVLP